MGQIERVMKDHNVGRSTGVSLLVDGLNATLVFDRPARRNALNFADWKEIARLIGTLDTLAIRTLTVRGAGTDFCAGADIAEFETARAAGEPAKAYEAANEAAFAAIRNVPVPTIAAIDGVCIGGGFGIAAACDIRLATLDARFSVPAGRIGLAYPVKAMADIVSALGRTRATALLMNASQRDSAIMLRWGFVTEVVADLAAAVEQWREAITQLAPLSLAASKAAILGHANRDLSAIERAKQIGAQTFKSADYKEGVAAFNARRAPVFRGS